MYFSYAYTGRPVVAVDVSSVKRSTDFGYQLFKNLSKSKLLKPCQFFPYKTEFNTLEEALNMDEQRATMAPGYMPWYIGWYELNFNRITYFIKIKEILCYHLSITIFAFKRSKVVLWLAACILTGVIISKLIFIASFFIDIEDIFFRKRIKREFFT